MKRLTASEAGRLGGIASRSRTSELKRQRVQKYLENPTRCKGCHRALSYEENQNKKIFCTQSCSATFNNAKRIRKIKSCINCKKNVKKKFCSFRCQRDYGWKTEREQLIKTGIDISCANRAGKRYLIECNGRVCTICNLSEWMGQAIPVVLDHIDGNSDNNKLNNLRIICNNCDALLPTFKARNRAEGRFRSAKRAARYKYEKNILNTIEMGGVMVD
jgi:hypothetical protein